MIDPPESDDELLHEFDTAKMDDHNHTVTFEQMYVIRMSCLAILDYATKSNPTYY